MTTNELRSNLAQAELQAVHVSLTAMAGHVAHWTPERIAADPEAAHAGLDIVSRSVSFISERIDLAMDMVRPETPEE